MNESQYNKNTSLVRRRREVIRADGFGLRSFVKRSNLPTSISYESTVINKKDKIPASYIKTSEPKIIIGPPKSPSMLLDVKTPYGALD